MTHCSSSRYLQLAFQTKIAFEMFHDLLGLPKGFRSLLRICKFEYFVSGRSHIDDRPNDRSTTVRVIARRSVLLININI